LVSDARVVQVEEDQQGQEPANELGFHRRHHLTERGVGLGGVDQRRHQIDLGIAGVGAQAGEGGIDGRL